MPKPVIFIFLLLILTGLSCDRDRVFDEYKPISKTSWHKDSLVEFNLGEIDSLKDYNLFINLRNNSDYRFSNIFLITEIQFPQGKVLSDTLEYEMTNPDGSWLGTRSEERRVGKECER